MAGRLAAFLLAAGLFSTTQILKGDSTLISISRRLALHLKSMFRRAFGNFRGPGPAICFTASAGMLNVKAMFADIAVEYSGPGDGTAETLWVPFKMLDDCEGKKDEPVNIEATGKKRVTAQWRDGSVPKIIRYDSKPPAGADKLPAMPEKFAENPPELLKALTAATDTCDPTSARFALGHMQLCPDGTINATDGRQLLVQSGFIFPWDNPVLIPRSKVFTSSEVPHDKPVQVAKSGDWVAIRVGPWTFWLAVNVDGRFPKLSQIIPSADAVKARCLFSPADADFLAETLLKLPCDDDFNHPVTLDLNGRVAVRAKGTDSPRATEVVLSGSSFSGESLRVNTNRNFLARAMRLGLRELHLTGDSGAILGCDAGRNYVWMPLDPESAIPPAEDALRIESPSAGPEIPVSKPKPQRRTIPVSEPANSNGSPASNGNGQSIGQSNGHAKANGRAKINSQSRNGTGHKPAQDIDGLIRQAEALRTSLRDTLLKTNDLLKGLKRHRRQSRALRNTIASLRQLKTLGV